MVRNRRVIVGIVGGGIALGVLVSAALLRPWTPGTAPPRKTDAGRNDMLASRFSMLSDAKTNQCNLTAALVMSMPTGDHLQGSCCRAMDFAHYVAQVRGLRSYAGVAAIPTDPYDIPVSLAKTLLSYERQINLTTRQQRKYDEALKLSGEHGPCCCHCWRWDVFEGQAKLLLAKLHFTPRQTASVWELEDGCGGPGGTINSS